MNKSVVITLIAALACTSCGYYSASSRTAGEIEKIAVPYFQNETAEPGIEIQITDNLIDGLVRDNTLKVVPEEEADAILEGSVLEYGNIPFTFNSDLTAEQYRLVINLNVSLFNRKDNTYIWENMRVSVTGDYYLDSSYDPNYDKALEEVYKDIVEKILNATVQEW